MYVKRLREFLNIWGFYGKMRTVENFRFQKIFGKYEFFRLIFTARLPWSDRARRISQTVANISTFFERSRRSDRTVLCLVKLKPKKFFWIKST